MTPSPFTADQRLRTLIDENCLLLLVLSRFGLPLHQANQSVDEVCRGAGVDSVTFLAVANLVTGRPFTPDGVRVSSLLPYLKKAHSYFLDFFLPSIRRKFLYAYDMSHSSDVVGTILRFFDDYVDEVRRHMNYENEVLFTYVDALVAGRPVSDDFSIEVFASHHDAISDKLNRLKDVLIRYSLTGNTDMINSVLYDIINCESDLISHCEVEDRILVPSVAALEASAVRVASGRDRSLAGADTAEPLGEREKEIICCVARGMSNKEIADRLCISIHTVTTHRRNISSKLEIHSPAGLTVYAILNGLIDPNDINL